MFGSVQATGLTSLFCYLRMISASGGLTPPSTMELLAPAGTVQTFTAALEAGADAVYVGAPGFNARALARDFTLAEIAAMVEQAHADQKKIYVAMNSLVKEDEIPRAVETLATLAVISPDALIIQDLGLLYLIRRFFPGLKVHASTLMTVNHVVAADYFAELGFERIVLARELSLAEIHAIHQHTRVELEIFIHGAMCFSYSGLCRFSSLYGGKSSLRGQCVQPCRRRYEWSHVERKKGGRPGSGSYIFSMNDLSGLDYLAEARAAGVVSLKIEGRLRSVEYVRNTVRAYRMVLDSLDAGADRQAERLTEAHRLLDAAMGRKRSSGYFIAGSEDKMIVPHLSGSMGTVVGRVVRLEVVRGKGRVTGAVMQVSFQEQVRLGDRLRLYEERTGERKNFTLRTLLVRQRPVSLVKKGQTATVHLEGHEWGNLQQPFRGLLFRVDISTRAEKSGTAAKQLLKRLPALPSCRAVLQPILQALAFDTGGDARSEQLSIRHRFTGTKTQSRQPQKAMEWWLKVRTVESLSLRFPFKVSKVVLDLNKENLEQFVVGRHSRQSGRLQRVWALPPVLLDEQLPWFRKAVEQLQQRGEDHFQISHVGQLGLFPRQSYDPDQRPVQLYGDYTCNVLNSAALHLFTAKGLTGIQFSLETDQSALMAALGHYRKSQPHPAAAPMQIGLYVHGRPPLFTSRLAAPHFKGRRSFSSPRGERFYLDQGEDVIYAYSYVSFSLLPYVKEFKSLGVDYVVVDISQGQPRNMGAEVRALLSGRDTLPAHSTGNYIGGLS
ncbi:MAG: peptidase U32 family protein [Desulfobulbus oligotrophicus]|nr:peptidase U32 family protein [Desulfobulbus oligotrophicus]